MGQRTITSRCCLDTAQKENFEVNALCILISTSLSLKGPQTVCPMITEDDGTATNLGCARVSVHAKASAERP